MCMIAGIIGQGEAAPILVEMQRRQEFIFGGFSTGIVTSLHNRIYRQRALGSIDAFERSADLSSLPGTIGIAHSRTDDGGGIEWAQPRLDSHEQIASVGNGIGGALGNAAATAAVANRLAADGFEFRTRSDSAKLNAVELADGTFVHGGEVALAATAAHFATTNSFESAIRAVNLRSESVGMYLTAPDAHALYLVNHNQSVVAAQTSLGMQVATSRLGFVGDTVWTLDIPANSFATVTETEVIVKPLWEDESRYDFTVPASVQEAFVSYVRSHPGASWGAVTGDAIKPLFRNDKATIDFIVSHRTLEHLLGTGRLHYEITLKNGRDGQLARQMSLFAST